MRVAAWPSGGEAASRGRAATGKFARLPNRGNVYSMPQNDTSNPGLIRTMSATLHPFPVTTEPGLRAWERLPPICAARIYEMF